MSHFTGVIRVVVIHELPQQEHNALLHLFSAQSNQLQYGATHYRVRSEETSTLLLQLFQRYRLEATLMPERLSVKDRVEGLSVDELLAALTPEIRAALAQRLRDESSLPKSAAKGSEQGEGK